MIKGIKQEYNCIANEASRLTRDVEYFLEASHPRKLLRNDFGAEVVSHSTVDEWERLRIKEILLKRNDEYCLVNYMQTKNKKDKVLANPCVYLAEPVDVRFIKEED